MDYSVTLMYLWQTLKQQAMTTSFVANRTEQRKSAYNQMINEWAYIGDGLVDTYESIEDIIESELN